MQLPYISFLLSFAFLNESIDGVVLGFDSSTQFQQILGSLDEMSSQVFEHTISSENEELLNPANWP